MPSRGANFPAETITLVDPATGTEYSQITDAPVHSVNLYFEFPSFTCDNRTLLFYSERMAMRGAPLDLLAADLESDTIRLLSDADNPLGSPCAAPDDPDVIYALRGTSLVKFGIESCLDDVLAHWDDGRSLGVGMLTGDGKYFVAIGTRHDGTSTVVRFPVDGGDVATFCDGMPDCHMTANRAGTMVMFSGVWEGGERRPVVCTIDGENVRVLPFEGFAHNTWYLADDELQGTLLPPGHGVVRWRADDETPETICAGPYFWHSGYSEDGAWIVTDTNWPDEGLMLIHVESGRYAPLVVPSSRGHASGAAQNTHPHPSFDRNASRVVYTSNETGLSQVYVATVPDGLRHELATGEITNRLRFRT